MTFSPIDRWVELSFALAFVGLALWFLISRPRRAKRAAASALIVVLPLTAVFRNGHTTTQAGHLLLIGEGVATALACILLALDARSARSRQFL